MTSGWVRLSYACDNACIFCSDADRLDGSIVDEDAVYAAIDAVAASGAERVVLSGGEPTRSKHLLKAIKHAKAKGLRVALTTNGRVVKSEKIAQMLEAAGVDEVRVSVHGGRRTTHDGLVGRQGAWVESLGGLRFFGRTGVETTMVVVLTSVNKDETAHLMHLGTMGGCKAFELRRLADEGAARAEHAALDLELSNALEKVGELWYEAKEEVLAFDAVGFDHTVDAGVAPRGVVRQADLSALTLLRRRVALPQAGLGFSTLGDEGSSKDLAVAMAAVGGLAQLGLELAAHGAPIVDAPWCVGGQPPKADAWGDDAHFETACDACPVRARCPGVPKKIARKLDGGDLAPRPHWSGVVHGDVVVCGGADDALWRERTLPALAEALGGTYAADVAAVTGDTLVCGGWSAAREALATNATVVVLDDGTDLGELPRAPALVLSWTPGQVGRFVAAGVDLRTVVWWPYVVPPGLDGRTARNGPIVVAGEGADWPRFATAMRALTAKRPPMQVFDTSANPHPALPGVEIVRDADDATQLAALEQARCLVLPTPPGHEGTPSARDLRWPMLAAACGASTVAVRAPGVSDQIRHGVTGFLAPTTGPKDLLEGLRVATTAPATLERTGAAAGAFAAIAQVGALAKLLTEGRLPDAPQLPTDTERWPPLPSVS